MDPIEVNQAASKAARAIRKSGGSGYVEKESLTNDGNNEGKETFKYNSLDFARIGDCIDPTAISKIDMLFNGSPLAISKDEIVVTNYTEHDTALSFNGAVGVWILGDENETGVSAGTYVLSAKTYGYYVTRIVTETIHPIDPKFIPGAVLPVVEIANLDAITAEGSAKLTSCIGMPCIIKSNGIVSVVFNYLYDAAHYFVPTLQMGVNALVSEDGVTWVKE